MITVIGSGSKGNCYFIDAPSPLLIEAGMPLNKIQERTGFRLSDSQGCLISHSHGDHCKYVKHICERGINCYMTAETMLSFEYSHHRTRVIKPNVSFKIHGWEITPFPVKHDADGSVGYFIKGYGERIMFSGDTGYIKYKFNTEDTLLTRIMVECNWDKETFKQAVGDGERALVQMKRLLKTHMSLTQTKDFLKSNNLSRVKEILLLHVSDSNGRKEYYKSEIEKLTGKNVRVA